MSQVSAMSDLKSIKKRRICTESKKEVSGADREVIIDLSKLGCFSTREIGEIVGVESSTVSKTVKRKRETGILKIEKDQDHLNWTAEDWKRVVFSDEVKFIRFGSNFRKFYWIRPGDPIVDDYIDSTMKYRGGGVIVWGCITSRGVGSLCQIKNTLNAEGYRVILARDLFGTLLQHDLEVNDIIFQHDGDSKHRATDTKNWLHYRNLKTFDWPPYSPDLNIIENIWYIIKQRLEKLYEREPAKDLNQL
ncbi:5966_t:CDS:2 [Racocetra fulgida]|uniref:5966_t:CDS:1 n=1 Tax=Racocetra fulgida TaxID=60492 RepID=A0A9N9CBY7_9GLOM|nr:5966_t:CDS:2 [Racocetra fulgida]